MCVVIQNLVLVGSEGDPTGGEGGTVRRPVAAADVPPGACARLAQALILLSPVESNRPPPAPSAFGTQEEDVHPTQDHKPPDHIRCEKNKRTSIKRDEKLPILTLYPISVAL